MTQTTIESEEVRLLHYTPKAGDRLVVKFPLSTPESKMQRTVEAFGGLLQGLDVKAVIYRGEVEISVVREVDDAGAEDDGGAAERAATYAREA